MESQWLPVSLVVWITALAGTLDAASRADRETLHRAALRPRSPHRHQLAARLRHGARLQTLYYLLGSVERKTPAIARALLRILLKRLPGDGAGTPLVFAIDDSRGGLSGG